MPDRVRPAPAWCDSTSSQGRSRRRGCMGYAMRCARVRATVVAAYRAAMSRGGRWRMASVSVIRPDATRLAIRVSRPVACRTTRPSRTTTHLPAYRSRSRSETGDCGEGRKSRQRKSRSVSSTVPMYPESVLTSTGLAWAARQRPTSARTRRATMRNGRARGACVPSSPCVPLGRPEEASGPRGRIRGRRLVARER
jgi:hypothetical protein